MHGLRAVFRRLRAIPLRPAVGQVAPSVGRRNVPAMDNTMSGKQPTIFVIGYPAQVAARIPELWHTVKLWRRLGLGVVLLPTGATGPVSVGRRNVPAMDNTMSGKQPTIFVIGYPAQVGGANTELWHTVKLWRRLGLGGDPRAQRNADPVGGRLGHRLPNRRGRLGRVRAGPAGRKRGGGCATPNPRRAASFKAGLPYGVGVVHELAVSRRAVAVSPEGTFDRHVFQSRYQRDQLVPQLRR